MLSFIESQVLFYLALILVFFLPGYFLVKTLETRKIMFSSFERWIVACGLSFGVVTFLMIIMGRCGMPLNRLGLVLAILLFILVCHGLKRKLRKKEVASEISSEKEASFGFSRNQKILFFLIISATILIKTIYLSGAIFPSATDLSHHTFWMEKIILSGQLPDYAESEIINDGEHYLIDEPIPIADFIIGEHLAFSAVMIIANLPSISSYPTLLLFFVHILGILASFILAWRLFLEFSWGKNAALLVLFLYGPLYAISSAQAKFVSGGVFGNIIGNFLVPLVIYFCWRSLTEKNTLLMATGIFFLFSIFYTHHLSALILSLVILVFAVITLCLFMARIKKLKSELIAFINLIWNPLVLFLIAGLVLFFFFVYTPSYIETDAVDTVVGTPTKSTKQGFTFSNISYLTGESRTALGFIGVLIFLIFFRSHRYIKLLLCSWIGVIFLMSWKPGWIQLNIPSARVVNYLALPITLSAGAAIAYVFQLLKKIKEEKMVIPKSISFLVFILFFAFILAGGSYDNSESIKSATSRDTIKTFHAGRYLAQKTTDSDIILKDHNYVPSDSWLKLFFMQDYNYPLTRSYFFRYEENPEREQCTNFMISSPSNAYAEKCYQDIGVNFVVVNPAYDSASFEESDTYSKVYDSNIINIFYRQ